MAEGDSSLSKKLSQGRFSAFSLRGAQDTKARSNKRLTHSHTTLRQRLQSRRTSQWGSVFSISKDAQTPKVRYQNTYRLESKKPFNRDSVTKIIKDTLERELTLLKKYDPEDCKRLSWSMAEDIRSQVKALEFDRYKIVTRVYIVEKLQQGIFIDSCFLWDAERDTFATYEFENMYVRAVAIVYGLYCD
ncbi:dynein light chain Tctex-type 5-B-like isoform X4 [Ischnura elegans]|uniref:dynein light chain Tctex-type 5-B-like isoform X4 n=1 Tax=Ischnura elegans TaxID=197161 RepID=UPI001ED89550|nr:dynein light chain Tctex-type 5-B-like isoform X4 [Ischnura elegans]